MKKIAVVVFNLGGPDSPAAIRPFLNNFFMDPAIIGAPWPVRFLLSRFISWKRGRAGGPAQMSYTMLGGKSPLLENTGAQAHALETQLNTKGQKDKIFSVHVCMRYWHPMSDAVVRDVAAENPNQIILLPLYPQFSTTTTGSSFNDWAQAAKRAGLNVPTHRVCCYPEQAGFVAASAALIAAQYGAMRARYADLKPPRVLFSAHGLPEKIIQGGDPYQFQCERTAAAIAAATAIPNLDWQICYQSRVGPLEWIKPSTEDALRMAADDQVPVLIYPHAFVSEHVETLVEIEHEYRDLARTLGVPAFGRVQTVGVHPDFIQGLADVVIGAMTEGGGLAPGCGGKTCDPTWSKCPCKGEQNG